MTMTMTTLYVARMGDTNYYKIGITGDVERRMAELQTPQAMKPILTLEGSSRDERFLHKLLADKRKNGEWFELDPQQVEGLNKVQNVSQLKQSLDPRPVVDPSELEYGHYVRTLAAIQKCFLHGVRPILRNIYYFLNQDRLQYDNGWPKQDDRRVNRKTVRCFDLMHLIDNGVIRRKDNEYLPLKVLSDPYEQIQDLCYIASSINLARYRSCWERGSKGSSLFKASMNSRTDAKIRVFKTQTQCEEFIDGLGLFEMGVVGGGDMYIYLCGFEVGGWSSAVTSDSSSFYLKKGFQIHPLVSRKSDGGPSYKGRYPTGIPRYWDLIFDASL